MESNGHAGRTDAGKANSGVENVENVGGGFVYNVPRAYVDQNLLNTASSAFDTRSDAAQLQTTQELIRRIRENGDALMREMSGLDSDPDSLESLGASGVSGTSGASGTGREVVELVH